VSEYLFFAVLSIYHILLSSMYRRIQAETNERIESPQKIRSLSRRKVYEYGIRIARDVNARFDNQYDKKLFESESRHLSQIASQDPTKRSKQPSP
jgi:hypothetical protein